MQNVSVKTSVVKKSGPQWPFAKPPLARDPEEAATELSGALRTVRPSGRLKRPRRARRHRALERPIPAPTSPPERSADLIGHEGPPRVGIEIVRLPRSRGLPLPTAMTPGSAGVDLCAAIEGELWIPPMEVVAVPTGLAIALPRGFQAEIRPRSGLARRHGLSLVNSPGTIDSDYRGEIEVLVIVFSREGLRIRRGDRIAQLVVMPSLLPQWIQVKALPQSGRGGAGFGSTGLAVEGKKR